MAKAFEGKTAIVTGGGTGIGQACAFALAADPANAALRARAEQTRGQRAAGQPTLPSRLGDERACNPFLRCDAAALHEAAERHAGRPLATPAEVFGALRGWKDGFRS